MFIDGSPKELATRLPVSADNLTKLWLLRVLVTLHGEFGLIGPFGWENGWLVRYLDLADCVTESGDPSAPLLATKLPQQLAHFEKRCVRKALPRTLAANVERLGQLLGLSPTGRNLLGFLLMADNIRLLAVGVALLDSMSTTDLHHALSVILALPEAAIRRELQPDAPLVRSGLVILQRWGHGRFYEKIHAVSAEFAERMLTEKDRDLSVFQDMFYRSRPAALERQHFVHVERQFEILRALLHRSRETALAGINILVYGQPGVGKTEVARLLASESGLILHEITSAGRNGEPLDGERRLNAYRAAGSLLVRGRDVLLFDEAEDIFGSGVGIFTPPSIAQTRKAWMNRLLEDARVPTIWLTNAIKGIDPAFVRRFSMVIEVTSPPRRRMSELVQQVAGDLLPPAAIGRLAKVPNLAPGVVTRAARTVRAVREDIGSDKTEDAMRLLIDATLVAQGHAGVPTLAANDAGSVYSTQFIAADADLPRIAAGIRQTRRGRLCLYGPPGTGKSAFGRWLADEIGAPLHVKRISDILSPYVGKSEQQMARTFRNAAAERAVLLLDEVDSFLQDRKGARHSWEVTQVNEMLTQIEAFEGVFIASTNLMDGLDPAALRRFDLKVRFGYLRPDQIGDLFGDHCRALGFGKAGPADRAMLESVRNLTPGDFAAVVRRHGFSPLADTTEFARAVLAEARMKREGRVQAIGFVANG